MIPTVQTYRGVIMKIEKLLKQAVCDGIITCGNCGKSLEPDAEICYCGWINPLRRDGYI